MPHYEQHRCNTIPCDIEEVIKETVRQTFITLGVDISNPIELQKDFAHLRSWRESTREIKKNGVFALIGIVVTGGAGLLWTALKTTIH